MLRLAQFFLKPADKLTKTPKVLKNNFHMKTTEVTTETTIIDDHMARQRIIRQLASTKEAYWQDKGELGNHHPIFKALHSHVDVKTYHHEVPPSHKLK